MIAEGTYRGKIFEYGLRETLKGDMMLTVRFVTTEGEYANWTGLFSTTSDAATARTVKNLQTFGFSMDRAADLASGKEGGVLNCDKEVELVVVHEGNDKGVIFPVVQWINETNKFQQVKKDDAVKFFSNFSFDSALKENPKRREDYKAANTGATVTTQNFDDIPF